tara:strand:- start:8888 stop:10273 length:1386 start_codon:yes stop_codon:yes gene_type:complete
LPAEFTYNEAVEKVMSLADFERSRTAPKHSSFHLERMSLLFDEYDKIHLKTPSIHIAGTNGKGSVATMVSSALSEAGYLTGLYTSPHLHRVTERIRLNGMPVSETDFAQLVSKTWPKVCSVSNSRKYGGVTTFEMMTLLAIIYFAEKQVDLQVIEVGLGGRLDATNLVNTEISVITPIGLDHVETLGPTISKIAREKAGIIKSKIPVVMAPQVAEAKQVIVDVANNQGADLIDVAQSCKWKRSPKEFNQQKVSVKTEQQEYEYELALGGAYQAENSVTSILALEQLSKKGYEVFSSPNILSNAFMKLNWPGRMEEIEFEDIHILLDGAHNEPAIEQLVNSIAMTDYAKTTIIFGALLGHRLDPMMNLLHKLGANLVAVKSRHPKSVRSQEIKKAAEKANINVLAIAESVSLGIKIAMKAGNVNQKLLVTGSLSVVAEARECLLDIDPELYSNIRIVETPSI